MCVKIEDACLPENIGDGTPEYSAPETSTRHGASLLSEIYAVGVIFVEGLMNNCPFGEKELLEAANDRLDDLEGQREDLLDRIEFDLEMGEEEDGAEIEKDEEQDGNDSDSTGGTHAEKLELVRMKEHRLGVTNDDGWEPNDSARVILAEMGQPLSFFLAQSEDELESDQRTKEEKGVMARKEAKAYPR
ncbi:unnamed protein product, partial [Pylaiella littoralis]